MNPISQNILHDKDNSVISQRHRYVYLVNHIVKYFLLLSFLITESQYPLSVHFIWNIYNSNSNYHHDDGGGDDDGYKKTRKCRSTANGQ
jgi:hypothetical protein